MAEKGATPPDGGRMNHEAMRRVMTDENSEKHIPEPIPGERDPTTATHSEPGIIAGTGYGENIPPAQPDVMDEQTRHEHEIEGGGDPGQRAKGKG